jgi:GNAT superfamily N-acetyltransferase
VFLLCSCNEGRRLRDAYQRYAVFRAADLVQAGLGDLLHDRHGALADERDGHGLGTHAVACDAAGGVGGKEKLMGRRASDRRGFRFHLHGLFTASRRRTKALGAATLRSA